LKEGKKKNAKGGQKKKVRKKKIYNLQKGRKKIHILQRITELFYPLKKIPRQLTRERRKEKKEKKNTEL
jgi:hypothetical protein